MKTNRFLPRLEQLGERIAPSVTPLSKPETAVVAEVRTSVEQTLIVDADAHAGSEETATERGEHAEAIEGPSYTVTMGQRGMLHLQFSHLPEHTRLAVQMPTGSYTVTLRGDDSLDLPMTPGLQATLLMDGEKLTMDLSPDGKPHDVEKEVEEIKRRDEELEGLHGEAELEEKEEEERERAAEEVARSQEEAAEAAREAAEHLEHLAHAHHHHHPHHEHKHEHHEHEESREEEASPAELERETDELFELFTHGRSHGNAREAAQRFKKQAEHERHELEHRLRHAYEPVERAYVRYLRERIERLERVIHDAEHYIQELERHEAPGRRGEPQPEQRDEDAPVAPVEVDSGEPEESLAATDV